MTKMWVVSYCEIILRGIPLKRSFAVCPFPPLLPASFVEFIEPSLLFIDLHLELIDNIQQVVLHHVVLKPIILVFKLLLHSLDVELCLQEATLCAVVGDVLE